MKKLVKILVATLVIVGGLYATTQTVQAKELTTKRIAKLVNKDLKDTEDFGSTKFKWNKKDKCFEATLDSNSRAYQSMNEGGVTLWESYTKGVKAESKVLKKNGYTKYSGFQVLNPDDTTKSLLQIYAGKTEYDVKDDLQ